MTTLLAERLDYEGDDFYLCCDCGRVTHIGYLTFEYHTEENRLDLKDLIFCCGSCRENYSLQLRLHT